MDKIQFLNAINYGEKQITDMIVNHLDQFMVLYDLVNSSDKITRLNDTPTSVTFQIDSENQNDSERIFSIVNTTPSVIRYGTQVVHMSSKVVSNKSLIIKMTKSIQ